MLCYIVCLVRRKLEIIALGMRFTDLCIVIEYKSKKYRNKYEKISQIIVAKMNYRDIIKT